MPYVGEWRKYTRVLCTCNIFKHSCQTNCFACSSWVIYLERIERLEFNQSTLPVLATAKDVNKHLVSAHNTLSFQENISGSSINSNKLKAEIRKSTFRCVYAAIFARWSIIASQYGGLHTIGSHQLGLYSNFVYFFNVWTMNIEMVQRIK